MTERNDFRAGLQPPRFGLTTLLVVITILCISFAAIKFFGSHGAIGVVVLLFAVFAHVLGNALGSQLRDNGNRPLPSEEGESLEHGKQRELTDDDFAPSTRLSQIESTGRITLILVALGAGFGAGVGTIFFLFLYWEKAEIWNIGAGAVAFAVLGGIGTFAAVGFLRASFTAVSHATAVSKGHMPQGSLKRSSGDKPRK